MKNFFVSVGLGWIAGNALLAAIGLTLYLTTASYLPSGWQVSYGLGKFDESSGPLEKTQVALIGLGALVAEEALYYTIFRDNDDGMLKGDNGSYILHFDKEDLPDVNAFWSITMYGKDSFLINNVIGRYAIGDRTKGLRYNDDESLDIFVSNRRPDEGESNWLPSPKGEFSITLRAYLPREPLLDGSWIPPELKKI